MDKNIGKQRALIPKPDHNHWEPLFANPFPHKILLRQKASPMPAPRSHYPFLRILINAE